MRIITGRARGCKLQAPAGEITRPTAERTKEAVFSMLQGRIEGRLVLDLFAGSGQMGLEAVSRGAARALLVDRDKAALAAMRANATHTKLAADVEIHAADAQGFLKGYQGAPFGLVFLDPPYDKGLLPLCLSLLTARNLLAEHAVLVCEARNEAAPFGGDEALAARFTVLRRARYGIAHITLLTPTTEEI
ncbi:MAG: 16S rRNA (guanine(966)-N(2))-methyltransferase RsmD [Clostridia bacterium]|nr:16S rRNA (guanine(966)-N(2))-methyltransferase RsmD [Clostridia bacterium]